MSEQTKFLKWGARALIATSLSVTLPLNSYAFQVSCASRGYWTAQALGEMSRLQEVLVELQNDPNCKGIESVVQQMQSAKRIMQEHDLPEGQNSTRFMNLPGEIAAIYSYVSGGATGALMESARSLLVNKILGMAAAKNNIGVQAPTETKASSSPVDDMQMTWESMAERTRRSSLTGMTMMQKVFEVLPNYEQCVSNRPNQSLALVSAAITMFAAFASGENGSTHELARTLSSMVTYMRNVKFGRMLGKLKQMEYWANLSCLLESTNNVYCNVQDTYALLDFQKAGYRTELDRATATGPTGLTREQMNQLGRPDHPLHGYYIMVREIPTISRWLQEVQFGVEPKLKQDADFKNATLTTMTNFLAAINNIKAIFNEKMVIYQRTTDINARRNQLFALLKDIVDNQLLGRMGEENFFSMAIPEKKLPFYLMGYEEVPAEVLPNQFRTHSANWADWIENGGTFRGEWSDPDKLLEIIRSRLWNVMDQASELGSNWFRQRFNVDPINLISRSVTDPNISAVESLVSVYGYLGRLTERLSKDTTKNYIVLPDLVDTIDRLQKVLGAFQQMRELTREFFPNGTKSGRDLGLEIAQLDPLRKKKIIETAGQILTETYIQFNIILQRDTFLANRLNTMVMYDYSDRVRRGEGMDQYVRDLMVVTGRNLIDRLIEAQGTNPNQARVDLDTAVTMLSTNMEVMEEMFQPDFESYLNNLLMKAGGTVFVQGGFMNPGMVMSIKGDDTPQRSFDQARARVCMQSLQFKSYHRFTEYCRGTVWRSQFDETPYKAPGDEEISQGFGAIYQAMKSFGPEMNKLIAQARKIEKNGQVTEAPMETFSDKFWVISRALFSSEVYQEVYKKPPVFHLSLGYDEMYKIRRETHRKAGYKQVCLVRDYLRRNHVYWLTKQFEDYQMDRFVQIQEFEKKWDQVEEERRRELQKTNEAAPIPAPTGAVETPTGPENIQTRP
ncbi:MAG: hypothetical protein KF767_07375 [Bdellovibrionaceae bacterium]|nr:hypothetical protein [Pseudobdellovibrionaceae bacterium]